MTDILALEPTEQSREVRVGSRTFTVWGLTLDDFIYLCSEFPEIRRMLGGQNLTAEQLAKSGPRTVASIVACANGHRGDAQRIAAAERLSISRQISALRTILELTFEEGVGPFVEEMEQLGLIVRVAQQELAKSSPNSPSASFQMDSEAGLTPEATRRPH